MPVQFRGVVRYLDADVTRVDLRFALEGLLDHLLDLRRARGRPDRDRIGHTDDAADLADHPLDFAALVIVLDLAIQRDPAVFHPGVDPALGDLHIPLQHVCDRPGDVRVVPRRAGHHP